MSHAIIRTILVAVGIALVVAAFVRQERINERLLGELAAARGSGAEGAAGGGGDERGIRVSKEGVTATEKGELARLRAEVSMLKIRTQELASVVSKGAPGAAPYAMVQAGAWKNSGKASPEAAAESLMWAADSGDLEALAGAIVLEGGAREAAAALHAKLPPEARKLYDSPEKLIALLLARDTDARAMQVLGASISGSEALVNLRLQKDDGKTKEEGYQFRNTGDGWRLVLPAKAVEKMSKKLSDPPKK